MRSALSMRVFKTQRIISSLPRRPVMMMRRPTTQIWRTISGCKTHAKSLQNSWLQAPSDPRRISQNHGQDHVRLKGSAIGEEGNRLARAKNEEQQAKKARKCKEGGVHSKEGAISRCLGGQRRRVALGFGAPRPLAYLPPHYRRGHPGSLD